jgi:hypothetical protein
MVEDVMLVVDAEDYCNFDEIGFSAFLQEAFDDGPM